MLFYCVSQDDTLKNNLTDLWALIHEDYAAMWTASIMDSVKSDSAKEYVGRVKSFERKLGFRTKFQEERVGSRVLDFSGGHFNGDAVQDTLNQNRKFKIKSGVRSMYAYYA